MIAVSINDVGVIAISVDMCMIDSMLEETSDKGRNNKHYCVASLK